MTSNDVYLVAKLKFCFIAITITLKVPVVELPPIFHVHTNNPLELVNPFPQFFMDPEA